jgi:hypothetical protein
MVPRPIRGTERLSTVSFLHGFGSHAGCETRRVDSAHVNRAEQRNVWSRQYFGRLVQLSRGKSLAFARGEKEDGWPGLEVAPHGKRPRKKARRLSFFPLAVSYHLCNHLANGRRARTMEGLFPVVVRLLLLQPAATRWSAAELY